MGILIALSIRFYLQANDRSLPQGNRREPLIPILLAAAEPGPIARMETTSAGQWVESLPVRTVPVELPGKEPSRVARGVDVMKAAWRLAREGATTTRHVAEREEITHAPDENLFLQAIGESGAIVPLSELKQSTGGPGAVSSLVALSEADRKRIEQEDRQWLDSLDLSTTPVAAPVQEGSDPEPQVPSLVDAESNLPAAAESTDTIPPAIAESAPAAEPEMPVTTVPGNEPEMLDPVLAEVASDNSAALAMSALSEDSGTQSVTDDLPPQPTAADTSADTSPSQPVTAAIGDSVGTSDKETDTVEPPSTSEETAATAPENVGEPRSVRRTCWPAPEALVSDLDTLRGHQVLVPWIEAVDSLHQTLNQLEFANPQSRQLIETGIGLAHELSEYSGNHYEVDPILASRLARLALHMQRRFAVWAVIHDALTHGEIPDDFSGTKAVVTLASTSRARPAADVEAPVEWLNYIMMDDIQRVFNEGKGTSQQRQNLARKVLARVSSTAITEEQSHYARMLIGEELGNVLRDSATGEFDPGQLLDDLEACEAGVSATAGPRLNSHFQNCYWSRYRDLRPVAEVLDEHYRAANFHIDVSDVLVNRVLPRNMTIYQPVQDKILGAQVTGNSQINNHLSVELIPDESRLSFRLNSNGNVFSRTRAMASGFVFNNLGNAMVNASKGVSIGPEGVHLLPADVVARSNSRLLNVKSRVDSVPLLGWMARSVAEQQQQQKSRQANMIVEQKLRSEFGSRVDDELQMRVEQGRTWLRDNVVTPLNALELEPGVADMRTTKHFASVSYRLAGLDQNAANTVRPSTPAGSLAGVQIHESAINNLISRTGICGETFTPDKFMEHVGGLIGRVDMQVPSGEHEDVKFQFASFDAVRFDFAENRVAITLRLRRMQIGRGSIWKNLTVTAWYIPVARGMQVDMLLDESRGVSLRGPSLGMADQLGARTVFNSLFKPSFSFPLLPGELSSKPAAQGLAVSDIVLVDGWAGIAIGSADASATHPETHNGNGERSARFFQGRWR